MSGAEIRQPEQSGGAQSRNASLSPRSFAALSLLQRPNV